MNKEEIAKRKIQTTLENHPEGLSVIELAKFTKLHRQTVAKYVLVLEAIGKIVRRKVGPVSLHYTAEYYSRLIRNSGSLRKVTM